MKRKDFGKNTWSLHQHCVPVYIILTSVNSIMRTETKAALLTVPTGTAVPTATKARHHILTWHRIMVNVHPISV